MLAAKFRCRNEALAHTTLHSTTLLVAIRRKVANTLCCHNQKRKQNMPPRSLVAVLVIEEMEFVVEQFNKTKTPNVH